MDRAVSSCDGRKWNGEDLGLRFFAFCCVAVFALIFPAHSAEYTNLGQYHANLDGPTSQHLRLPGADGHYRDWLSWGYPIWEEYNSEPLPQPGWWVSEDLTKPPYDVPADATAVRLHIKAKVAGVTWAENMISGVLQVSARPHGSDTQPNEIIHSAAGKPAGNAGFAPYDLNHVEVDVVLGDDHKLEIFAHPSIIGDYVQIDLIVYVAGYWL